MIASYCGNSAIVDILTTKGDILTTKGADLNITDNVLFYL